MFTQLSKITFIHYKLILNLIFVEKRRCWKQLTKQCYKIKKENFFCGGFTFFYTRYLLKNSHVKKKLEQRCVLFVTTICFRFWVYVIHQRNVVWTQKKLQHRGNKLQKCCRFLVGVLFAFTTPNKKQNVNFFNRTQFFFK